MKKFLFFIFIFLTISLSAQSPIATNFELRINQHLFNGNWQISDSLITLKLNENPNSVKYNFLKAYNYFYTRYIGNDNPYSRDETIRQVKKYAWEAITIGEELNESIENNFYIGSAYAYLSRINVMEQDFWLGYWNASKAENYFEDVLDENPQIIDAYFNLGVTEYFPAVTVTGFQSVLAWLGGMSGDREEGITKIKRVAEDGILFKNEANFALGLIFSFRENDLITGYDYWSTLTNKYPDNNNFGQQLNRAYIGKLVEEKGVEFLNNEFDQLDSLYDISNPNVLNNLGYTLVNQNRLDEALVVFKVNLKKYPEIANCYDSLAECYMTMGENDKAIKYYKMAFEKLKTDTTVNDQFRERLEEGIKNNLDQLGSKIDV